MEKGLARREHVTDAIDNDLVEWVGREVLPHEADCRSWLRNTLAPDDLEDVIQEAYCRIASLAGFREIRSGRAYFFTTARMIVIERLRRARIVQIEAVAELEQLGLREDSPSPERIVAGHRELQRVRGLIERLPPRCANIFRLRKIEGLSQRDVARRVGVAEHTVEYEIGKGLRLILKAMAEGEEAAEAALSGAGYDERTRNVKSDQ
jgi:RNA polymerase sigma factor (sigma-70 family)